MYPKAGVLVLAGLAAMAAAAPLTAVAGREATIWDASSAVRDDMKRYDSGLLPDQLKEKREKQGVADINMATKRDASGVSKRDKTYPYSSYAPYAVYGKYPSSVEASAAKRGTEAKEPGANVEPTKRDKAIPYGSYVPYGQYDPYGPAVEAEAARLEAARREVAIRRDAMTQDRGGQAKKRDDYAWYSSYQPYTNYGDYSSAESEAAEHGMAPSIA